MALTGITPKRNKWRREKEAEKTTGIDKDQVEAFLSIFNWKMKDLVKQAESMGIQLPKQVNIPKVLKLIGEKMLMK